MLPKLDSPIFNKLSEWQSGVLDSLMCTDDAFHTEEHIISWFTGLKAFAEFEVVRCDIDKLDNWEVNEWAIENVEQRYFKVIGVEARIGNREVATWCQPLVEQRQEGIIGYIVKKINGVYHLLVQAKLEPGNFDVLEMAPTVQCVTGNYKNPEWMVPYLEYFLGVHSTNNRFDTHQSEEGGRFFCEQNRYVVVEVGDEFPILVDGRYIWMTLRQAKQFIKFNNYFNIEARSLIACISPI